MAEQILTSGFVELNEKSIATPQGISELNRMLRTLFLMQAGDNESQGIYKGYGTPESNISAKVGSLYLRLDGGSGTTVYAKESGTGATGWSAL